jgi:hypothetical protein
MYPHLYEFLYNLEVKMKERRKERELRELYGEDYNACSTGEAMTSPFYEQTCMNCLYWYYPYSYPYNCKKCIKCKQKSNWEWDGNSM